MDPALEGHRRYLAALRDACDHHPAAHSHQLAALARELDLTATAADIPSYLAASGNGFELTRSAWLDRAANHARVAAAVDDRLGAEAAAIEHSEALAARGHGDWTERVAAGSARAAPLRTRSAEARSAFTRLLLGLLRMHGAGTGVERDDLRLHADDALATLRAGEAGRAWFDLVRRPRYRWRMPWTSPGSELVAEWVGELDSTAEATRSGVEAGDPVAEIEAGEARGRVALEQRAAGSAAVGELPTAAEISEPYRQLAESLEGDDPATVATRRAAEALAAAGAGAETAQDALARFVADGLLVALAAAPVRANAEQALARQSVWPDPLVEHHWSTLLAELGRARTETEVELVSVHAEACFAVEADWNVVLLAALFSPLRAACAFGWNPTEETRWGVECTAGVTHGLLGLGPRRAARVPRVADFVARILVPLAAGDDSDPAGAHEGEAGFELLGEARAWTEALWEEGGTAPRDAAEMHAALVALFDRAGVAEPPAAPRPVTLWGAVIEPDDLVAELARPRRPSIPGLEPGAADGSGL